MADIDLKTQTPDASINDSAFLFGADSQSSASPSVYAVSTLRNHFNSSANLFTTAQTISPLTDVTALTARRSGAGSVADILQLQDESNNTLTSFSSSGQLTSPGVTISSGSLTMSGNISSAAWTTNGILNKGVSATLTDTTSSGTVAAAYTNVYSGNTIAASNSTTFTDYFTTYINAPSAGTNVTFTRNWALGLSGSLKMAGQTLTGSQSQSLLDLAQTWNTTGTPTGLKLNVTDTASNDSSLFIDLQVNGSSKFSVSKAGRVTSANSFSGIGFFDAVYSFQLGVASYGLILRDTFKVYWSCQSSANTISVADLILGRNSAASLRFGDADVGATSSTVTITIASPAVISLSYHNLSTGTPVVFTTTGALPTGITAGTTYYVINTGAVNTFRIATSVANAFAGTAVNTSGSQSGTHTVTRYAILQSMSVQSVAAGVTDIAAPNWYINGAQGTGTGAGGSIVFQVAPAGSTGTAQNALATALTLDSTKLATFADAIKTAAPNTGTAAKWKLGSRVAATVALDTTQYIELDVGGTLYKLAVVT